MKRQEVAHLCEVMDLSFNKLVSSFNSSSAVMASPEESWESLTVERLRFFANTLYWCSVVLPIETDWTRGKWFLWQPKLAVHNIDWTETADVINIPLSSPWNSFTMHKNNWFWFLCGWIGGWGAHIQMNVHLCNCTFCVSNHLKNVASWPEKYGREG